jgi:hypothetical protein
MDNPCAQSSNSLRMAMAEARPLHLHTVESVCTDLIGGRPSVSILDAEAIVDAAKTKPPSIAETKALVDQKKRSLTLVKVEAHLFGGLHAFSDGVRVPDNFIWNP